MCCGDCEVETAAAEGAQLLNLWMADKTDLWMFSAKLLDVLVDKK